MPVPDSTPLAARHITADGEPTRRQSRITTGIEQTVAIHFGVLSVFTAWAFGGQTPWVRNVLLGWGTVGLFLFIIALTAVSRRQHTAPLPLIRPLWPLLLFNIFVGASCFNPSFRQLLRDGEPYFAIATPPYAWLPSSARPSLTLRELWQFNTIVIGAFNLYLVLNNRRILRTLLLVFATNGVALAIFGTLQKLVGAKGLWFGLVKSPNDHFFSTFIYHNHWGAFTVLNVAAFETS